MDQRLGEIETALAAFEARPVVYDPTEIARAGVFVSIDADGDLRIERGYVRPEDEAPVEPVEGSDGDAPAAGQPNGAIQRTVITVGSGDSSEPEPEGDEDDGLKPLSERLVTELTAHRTLALRDALANDPDTAFAAVLYTLCLGAFYRDVVSHLPRDLGQEHELQRPGAGTCRQRLRQGDRGPPSAMGEAVAQGRGRSLGRAGGVR